MTNEETINEVVNLVNLVNNLRDEFKKYTDEIKTYVDKTIETHNKISTKQVEDVISHADKMTEQFNKHVTDIQGKLTAHGKVNLERNSDIIASNKLIAAAPLSPYFHDPIKEINKLIGDLK
jgi:uncharacterized coiled-coil DUF342 family protein